MPASGSANVQYGHVTDNKLSRQSHRKNRETIREFSCCNKHEIISSFSHIVGKNAFFCDHIGCIMSVLWYMHVLLAKVHENVHRFFDNTWSVQTRRVKLLWFCRGQIWESDHAYYRSMNWIAPTRYLVYSIRSVMTFSYATNNCCL